MPSLQLHQLRVAAVGKLVCEHFTQTVNKENVVLACLFHDIGNIVKFKLRDFPELSEPQGVTYWEGVQKEIIQTYGPEQHTASAAIAGEIGLSENIVSMIANAGFMAIPEILRGESNELKVLQYADLRVSPTGIVSVEERLSDFMRRYKKKGDEVVERAAHDLERTIFEHVDLRPEDITDAAVAPIIEELWEYPVA